MPAIGFSTGALFQEALAEGVAAALQMRLEAIELSALRLRELSGLREFVQTNDLTAFTYISLHAPTDYPREQEEVVASILLALVRQFKWHVVVHPDCLWNKSLWLPFGEWLCIENMDKRKTVGRTVEELRRLFIELPEARLCFDIAHAHQIDTSMTEAFRILREFGERVCELHVSEVTSSSKHSRISETALRAFQEVADQLPRDVPVILETPVAQADAAREIHMAARIFESSTVAAW